MTGTIKTVDQRGFGFILGDDGVRRFFHAKWLRAGFVFETLQQDQRVRFKPTAHPLRGPRAVDVRLDPPEATETTELKEAA